jgi:hypothetical protein
MTGMPHPAYAARPPSRWGAGRIIALVLGIVLLLPGLGLLLGGGVLLWADQSNRNSEGYLVSGQDTLSTPGYALTSENVDLATGAAWMPVQAAVGKVQIKVTGTGGSDVFVGVAPVRDAAAYISGVQHSVISDLGTDTSGTGVLVPGDAPTGAPADQSFWVSQASGPGTQQLTWSPADGNWMIVVMNADASAGVVVKASIGATVPSLGGFAWGVLIGGGVLTAIGVLLLVIAARRPAAYRSGPTVPGAYAGPVGPPPAWAPPAPRPPDSTRNEPVS